MSSPLTRPGATSPDTSADAADGAQPFDPDAALETFTPPPSDQWVPDILGPGFEARTIDLLPDDDGPVVATLVRHLPREDPDALFAPRPRFVVLYLHGWNDYFHQRELARQLSSLGGAFYALDLRRYGRSLRPGNLRGYVESLSTYDEDIHGARDLMREDHPDLDDVVLMGHSTGGLIASLWAHRHPGALRALVLNAPWLDIQGSWLRAVGQPVIDGLARFQPKAVLPLRDFGFYNRTLRGAVEEIADLSPEQQADPAVTGWPIEWAWRVTSSAIRPGWLAAVLEGHRQVADGLEITCPVLVLAAETSVLATRWSPQMRRSDTVIDVDLTARRALGLGSLVTIARVRDAVHDVMLSTAPVRSQAYRELTRWLRAYAAPGL